MLSTRSAAALLAMITGSPSASVQAPSAAGVLASCPATLPAGNALPKGGRLIGSAPLGTPLRIASATDQSPAQVRPDGEFLAEIESESISRQGMRRTTASFDSTSNPVSLVCRYGGVARPGRGTAMLLLPLPAATTGDCIVTGDMRAGRKGLMTAICTRTRR